MTDVSAGHSSARKISGLRLQLMLAIALIAIEIALGVAVNLFAKLPAADKGTSGFSAFGDAIASGPASLAVHTVVGTLILLAGISVLIRTISIRSITQIVLAALGLLTVLMAWGSGTAFIGSQADGASFSMTIGTVVALLSYTVALFVLRAPATEQHPV
jgi:hypothetical protein